MAVTEHVCQQLYVEPRLTTAGVGACVGEASPGGPGCREDDVRPRDADGGGGLVLWLVGPGVRQQEKDFLEVGPLPGGGVEDFGGFCDDALVRESYIDRVIFDCNSGFFLNVLKKVVINIF